MDYKYILYEPAEKVAKVTINRPQVLNAISRRVYKEVDDAFHRAEQDDEIRVIVLGGVGDHFGAGHDIGSKDRQEDAKEDPPDTSPVARIRAYDQGVYWYKHEEWRNLGKPIVGMIQGYCMIGSWMLAVCCDILIAAEDAKFADRVVRWGGTYSEYPAYLMELGPRKAKEHLWTGDFIDGAEAWRLGLVNRVVPRERLEEETMALASRIALNDPIALRLTKIAINQTMDITGWTAAVKTLCYRHLGSARSRNESSRPPGGFNVELAKLANQRFEEQDKPD